MIARLRGWLPGALQLAGMAGVVGGVWRVSVTAGLIVAGLFALVTGVAVEH